MTTEVTLFVLGQAIFILGIGIGAYVSVVQRVTKLEAIVSLLGEKAAKILHSPHTPELDALIEKHIEDKLEDGEIDRFLQMLLDVENDPNEVKAARLAAVLARISVCRRYRRPIPDIPMPMLRLIK